MLIFRTYYCFLLLLWLFSAATYAEIWYTGPLLVSPAETAPKNHLNLQLYLLNPIMNQAYLSNWSTINTQQGKSTLYNPQFFYGLTDIMDIEASMLYQINRFTNTEAASFGDTFVALGFQVLSQQTSFVDLRLTLGEVFPTGRYNHLDPQFYGSQATGFGSYQTNIAFNFLKLMHLQHQLINGYFSFTYQCPSTVPLDGISVYGGTPSTHGIMNPGSILTLDVATEWFLSQNWAWVFEGFFDYQQANSFHGNDDPAHHQHHPLFPRRSLHIKRTLGNGNFDQFSLAPAIEYNGGKNLGVIAGVWFSIAGKNAPVFVTPMIELNVTW